MIVWCEKQSLMKHSSILNDYDFCYDLLSGVEGLFVELNFWKSKWLLFGTYHPSAPNDQYLFNYADKAFDTYSNYDNALFAGDFNVEDDEPCLHTFLYQHDFYNLVKVGACFENSSKPTSIDLFVTIKNAHFRKIVAVCSGLSNFQKLVLMVLISSSNNNKPCEILYRDYKKFNSESFNEDLQNILSTTQINTCWTWMHH